MELSFGDDSSDKDNKMKKSLESSDSSSEKKHEKSEKKPLKKNIPLFKMLGAESDSKQEEKQLDEVKSPDDESGILGMIKKASEREKDSKQKESGTEESSGQDETSEPISDTKEADNNLETEVKLDEISEEEITEVVNSYVNVGIEDSRQHLSEAEPDSVEAAEESASIAFLESLKKKIELDNKIADEDITKIADDVSEQISEEKIEESTSGDYETSNTELDQDIIDSDIEEQEEDDFASNSSAPVGGTPVSPIPPISPAPPAGMGNSAGGGGPNLPPVGGNANYNAPVLPNPNIVNNQNIEYSINRRRAGDFLVGGIIGYLIGKRRGRIKAEKNLLPIQEKLEKQVVGLQSKLYEQEEKVRQVAASKFETKVIIATPENKQNIEPKQKESTNSLPTEKVQVSQKVEKGIEQTPEMVREQKPEVEQSEKRLSPKSVEIMSLPMILDIAENIKLGGNSLKNLYESREISQAELREVVEKYLRGERIDRLVGEFVGERAVVQEHLKDDFEKQSPDSSSSSGKDEKTDNAVGGVEENASRNSAHINENMNNIDSFNGVTPVQQENKPSLTPIYVTAVMAVIVGIIIIILFT